MGFLRLFYFQICFLFVILRTIFFDATTPVSPVTATYCCFLLL